MKLRYLCFAFLGMMVASDAMAINLVNDDIYGKWMLTVEKETFGDASEGAFIVAGALGKGMSSGTWGDEEGAIVAVVAVEIVEHGGYFCPLQIQCVNMDEYSKIDSSWTRYYHPSGYSADKCAWLCETGYAGHKCAKQTSYLPQSKTLDLTSGISLKKEGKDAGNIESQVYGLDTWGYDGGKYQNEKDVLLGAVSFQEHGVMATPVSIACDKVDAKSFVNKVAAYSNLTHKLLCAEGYTANHYNTECVPMTVEMLNLTTQLSDQKKMCAGWTEEGYDSAIHNIDATGNCIKYMCKDKTKAFPAPGNYECAECAGSVRGGQNPLTGLCVKCEQLGQYFDTKTSECKNAMAFTKTDMQYGKGKTKETNTKPENQCWTKVSPDEYKDCVFGKVTPLLSSIKFSGVVPLNIGLANAYIVNTSTNSTNSKSTGTTSTNSNSTNSNNYTGGALVLPGGGGGSSAPAVPQYNNGSYINNPYANQVLRMDATIY